MPKRTFFNLPDDKRERITSCAVEEFAEHGYADASISRMVASAGIAKGSFYQYFEDKEDLYGYIISHAIVERKMRIANRTAVKLEDLNLTEFIRVLFRDTLAEFKSYPSLLKISLDFWRPQREPVQERIIGKYKHISGSFYTGFIETEKAQGEIDPRVDTPVLNAMLMGIGVLLTDYIEKNGYAGIDEEYVDALTDKIEYILINGIYKGTAVRLPKGVDGYAGHT